MENISKIHEGIDKAHQNALKLNYSTEAGKIIVFSDHHRGKGDGADDFKKCEFVYKEALNYYFKGGFTLILLGDIEEFWENKTIQVLKKYKEVGQLEKQFYNQKRLYKVWGNHDDNWRFADFTNKYLGKVLPNLQCYEAIELNVKCNNLFLGNLLLLHGHQGTLASDRWAWFSKIFVRYFWRNFQRIFKININTPQKDKGLKSKHDLAFYQWASSKKQQAIICGHTHQPVFISDTHLDKLDKKIKQSTSQKEKELIQEKIKSLSKNGSRLGFIKSKNPCYFNTGCCSFSDGDITGIEIDKDIIRLIKWEKKGRKVLDEVKLENIF